jgi:hypothetical protein
LQKGEKRIKLSSYTITIYFGPQTHTKKMTRHIICLKRIWCFPLQKNMAKKISFVPMSLSFIISFLDYACGLCASSNGKKSQTCMYFQTLHLWPLFPQVLIFGCLGTVWTFLPSWQKNYKNLGPLCMLLWTYLKWMKQMGRVWLFNLNHYFQSLGWCIVWLHLWKTRARIRQPWHCIMLHHWLSTSKAY